LNGRQARMVGWRVRLGWGGRGEREWRGMDCWLYDAVCCCCRLLLLLLLLLLL
jgi:hypothetical protein